MLIRNMLLKYHDQAGPDGGEAGGAGGAETFTAEQVQAMIEKETGGLKAKVDELLGEKKTAAQRAKDAEAEKLRIEQEAARNNGKLDEFEASLRGEFDKERGQLQSRLDDLTNKVVGSSKKSILAEFAGEFITPESLDVVSQLVKTGIDGQDLKTEFTDFAGNVITTDPAEFKKWMSNHPAISHLMKADGASGGGAAGGKGGGRATSFKDMTVTERAQLANKDPAEYARLSGIK